MMGVKGKMKMVVWVVLVGMVAARGWAEEAENEPAGEGQERVSGVRGEAEGDGLEAGRPGEEEERALGVTVDTTYVSKYIWRGYDIFDDHAALQPSVNWDIFETGFFVNVWGSIPMGSGNEVLTEMDYTVGYGTTLFAEEWYAVEVGVNYIYYDFPKVNSTLVPDTQEVGMRVALPKLLPMGDSALVPSYYVGKLWCTDAGLKDQDGADRDVWGGYHNFGLSYDVAVPKTEQVVSVYGEAAYNDGMFGADQDWSHATVGVSMSIEVAGVTIRPFLNYQISMEDTVNEEDELYGGVSVSVAF